MRPTQWMVLSNQETQDDTLDTLVRNHLDAVDAFREASAAYEQNPTRETFRRLERAMEADNTAEEALRKWMGR